MSGSLKGPGELQTRRRDRPPSYQMTCHLDGPGEQFGGFEHHGGWTENFSSAAVIARAWRAAVWSSSWSCIVSS